MILLEYEDLNSIKIINKEKTSIFTSTNFNEKIQIICNLKNLMKNIDLDSDRKNTINYNSRFPIEKIKKKSPIKTILYKNEEEEIFLTNLKKKLQLLNQSIENSQRTLFESNKDNKKSENFLRKFKLDNRFFLIENIKDNNYDKENEKYLNSNNENFHSSEIYNKNKFEYVKKKISGDIRENILNDLNIFVKNKR